MIEVADAILARIKSVVPATVTVFDGKVTTDANGDPIADRYVAFYPQLAHLYAEDVGNTINLASFRFQLTYVGRGVQADRWAVQWLAGKCQEALTGWRPSAAGWQAGPVVHEGGQPITDDPDEPGVLTLFATDSFSLLASRA